jgi:hypothetical protein
MSQPSCSALLQPEARGAVEVVVHLGPFGELAALAHGEEVLHVDEVVFAAVLFAGSRLRAWCRK